jgi:hypothetical protein
MSVIQQRQELTLEEELKQASDRKYVPDLYERNLHKAPVDTSISVDPQNQRNQHSRELPLEEENTQAGDNKYVPGLYESNFLEPPSPADTSISVDQQNLQQRKLPLEEELIRPSESKNVPGLYKSDLHKAPVDTSIPVNQQNRQRKKLPLKEKLNQPIDGEQVLGLFDSSLYTASTDKSKSVDHRKDLYREGMTLHQSSFKRMYPKHNLTIKWIFILLLTTTLFDFVSATDCEIMSAWLSEMFTATGTECCAQAGITCVSDRITEM